MVPWWAGVGIRQSRTWRTLPGTWIQMPHDVVKLFHVNWNYDANGALAGESDEIQINTVSQNGNSYQGTYDIKDYDVNGNFLSEEKGTVSATRLSVP